MIEIKNTILEALDGMTDSERRLADVVLSHMDQIAVYSANELAAKAHVSPATAVRFFRRLGFTSFNDFRLTAREGINAAAPLQRLPQTTKSGIEMGVEPFVRADVQNINETFMALTKEQLDVFTAGVLKARRVWIVGFRNGQILASYLHALLQQLRGDVMLLVGLVAHLPERLTDIESDDFVIVMDFRRRSVLLKTVVQHARREAAGLAFVTDNLEPPVYKKSDTVFLVSTRGQYLFDSHVATLSVLNFLACQVGAKSGKRAQAKLQKIEAIHKTMKDINSL